MAENQINEIDHKLAPEANLFRSNTKLKNKTHREKWFGKECEIIRTI